MVKVESVARQLAVLEYVENFYDALVISSTNNVDLLKQRFNLTSDSTARAYQRLLRNAVSNFDLIIQMNNRKSQKLKKILSKKYNIQNIENLTRDQILSRIFAKKVQNVNLRRVDNIQNANFFINIRNSRNENFNVGVDYVNNQRLRIIEIKMKIQHDFTRTYVLIDEIDFVINEFESFFEALKILFSDFNNQALFFIREVFRRAGFDFNIRIMRMLERMNYGLYIIENMNYLFINQRFIINENLFFMHNETYNDTLQALYALNFQSKKSTDHQKVDIIFRIQY